MTQEFFVHPNTEGGVTLVMVAPNCGIPLLEVARKDTPDGVPFRLLPKELMPEDQTFFNAWECDFSNPDGYGIGSSKWFIEKYQNEKNALNSDTDQARIAKLDALITMHQEELNT